MRGFLIPTKKFKCARYKQDAMYGISLNKSSLTIDYLHNYKYILFGRNSVSSFATAC